MSAKLMGQVFDLDLPSDLKLLLLALADHAWDDGTHVYPSVRRLAKKVSRSERSVKRKLATLRSMGYLVVVSKGGGRGMTTRYRLPLKGDKLTPYRTTVTVATKTVTAAASATVTAVPPEPSMSLKQQTRRARARPRRH